MPEIVKPFYLYNWRIPEIEGDFGERGALTRLQVLGSDEVFYNSERYKLAASALKTDVVLRKARLPTDERAPEIERKVLFEGAIMIYNGRGTKILANRKIKIIYQNFDSLKRENGFESFLFYPAENIEEKDEKIERILMAFESQEERERRKGIEHYIQNHRLLAG